MRSRASRTVAAQNIPLRASEYGATIIEFAIVAPMLILIILAGFDVAHMAYVKSVLEGELNNASRASGLGRSTTTEAQAAIDEEVRSRLKTVTGLSGEVTFLRTAYHDYEQVGGTGEPFIDANEDGVCNHGETFRDFNGNGRRDSDSGLEGGGSGQDVVVYEATVTKSRLFPFSSQIGLSDKISISGRTMLRNQPYENQNVVKHGRCM